MDFYLCFGATPPHRTLVQRSACKKSEAHGRRGAAFGTRFHTPFCRSRSDYACTNALVNISTHPLFPKSFPQTHSLGSSIMPKSNPAKSQSKAGTTPGKGKAAAAASDSAAGSVKPKAAAVAEKTPETPVKAAAKKAPAKEAVAASKKKPEGAAKKTVSDGVKPKTPTPEPPNVAQEPTSVPRPPVVKTKLTDLTDPFLVLQRDRIFQLRDSILESMQGVAKDTLRSRAEGSEASAFGMHQADAGSDAYDRDFALSLLSQEQDALYEIEEALKRMELGSYGVCEMSGKKISHARLEALPFARYTVECQAEVERQKKLQKARMPVTSLFGLTDEEGGEGEDEDQIIDTKE